MLVYKRLFKALSLLLLLSTTALVSNAAIEVREFSSDENREAYHALTKELRCPKCQNQDIADSNAPIAQDMRQQVHRLVEEGKSHEQVVGFMVERFGEFVTYKPKVSSETLLLWYGPWVLILVGVSVIVVLAYKKRGASEVSAGSAVNVSGQPRENSHNTENTQEMLELEHTPEQKKRLHDLLDKYGDD